jgi:hypothetical protein
MAFDQVQGFQSRSIRCGPIIVDFFDADRLTGEERAEIDFLLPRQMWPQRVSFRA